MTPERSLHRHPQATHHTQLGEVGVAYVLVRSARRTIGLEVGPEGLTVRAPWRASQAQIALVLVDKARWVLDKLNTRAQHVEAVAPLQWAPGASLPYLGGQLQLQLHPAAPPRGQLLAVGAGQWVLHLPVEPNASAAAIRAAVTAWWLDHARAHFQQRLVHWAPLLGVTWRSLRLTNARTRWGSAKTDGSLMLNWRLLHFAPAVIDYVVVHELSHLRVMDHSPRFWRVVASVCPDYAALRQTLRRTPLPPWA